MILGQLSLPFIWGRSIKYRPVWLGLRRGVFTCVRWQVTLRSCVMEYVPLAAIQYFLPLITK